MNSGIPLITEYKQAIESPTFRTMERFSDDFLGKNKTLLSDFIRSWVRDPLHQWSRRWEYPYVYSHLASALNGPARILDAGSGVTFFPYFLSHQHPGWSIVACDYDVRFAEAFQRIPKPESSEVSFVAGDLRALPFADASFDAIYCISVLEHTGEYPQILNEFYRILKPSGRLILTFDISLDGFLQLSLEQANGFLENLNTKFQDSGGGEIRATKLLERLNRKDQIVTSYDIIRREPETKPWKYPRLSALKASLPKGKITLELKLSFACLDLSKR